MKRRLFSVMVGIIILFFSVGCAKNQTESIPTVRIQENQIVHLLNDLSDENGRITRSFSFKIAHIEQGKAIYVSSASFSDKDAKNKVTVQFVIEDYYTSPEYSFNTDFNQLKKAWRVPPLFTESPLLIKIHIPAHNFLQVEDFSICYKNTESKITKINLNAHLGFMGYAPECTKISWEISKECGFDTIIMVPKLTKDGELVCIHDDTINRTARKRNGSAVNNTIFVSELTYRELLFYDFGLYKNKVFGGEKIPLLNEFFEFCAENDISPMLSCHPEISSEHWKKIENMLEKLNLIEQLNVKSFNMNELHAAFRIFGDRIKSYTLVVENASNSYFSALSSLGIKSADRLKVFVEYKYSDVNRTLVEEAHNSGFEVSVWNVPRITGEDYDLLYQMGVTSITEDYNCCNQLNW